jgi:hypothetical protein
VQQGFAAIAAHVRADPDERDVVALTHHPLDLTVHVERAATERTTFGGLHGFTLDRKSGDQRAGSGL